MISHNNTEVKELRKMPPCQDSKLQKLCLEYQDILVCCDAIVPRKKRFRERAKILWGKADCVDLFELRKELLKSGYFRFKVRSWCMFPVLKKGDILKIESAHLKDINIGEIPVYRRDDSLYAHRIVDKQIIDEKEYMLTRPDTSKGITDVKSAERVSEEDALGKIKEIISTTKMNSHNARKATLWERFQYAKDKIYIKGRKLFLKVLNNGLAKIQSFWFYNWVGKRIVKRLEPAINFQLLMPSKSKLEIYKYRPLEKIDIGQLTEYKNFHILMKFKDTPIGCATFLNRPNNCPYKGLWLSEMWIRLRYRGIGLESLFVNKAQDFLRKLGIKHIFYPKTPSILKHPLFYFNAQRLLILLSKGKIEASLREQALVLINEGIRWKEFPDIVIAGGKEVAIMQSFKVLGDSVYIPDFVIERLENARLKTIAETARNHRELLRILNAFSQAGIPLIPLKSTYLAQRLYGDITLRGRSADLDFLIKEEDKEKSIDLMKGLGYKQRLEEEIKAWRWHVDFFQKGLPFIDLHWDITMMARNRQRIEGLWQQLERSRFHSEAGDEYFYQWQNETLLIYLCVTLINSKGYRNLRYFFDVDALIKNSDSLDWQMLIVNAYKYRVNNSVYASLTKAKELVDTKVPRFVLDRLKPSLGKKWLIHLFLARSVIFEQNLRRRILDKFLSYILFELLEAASLADFLKIAKRVLLPPKEVLEMAPSGSSGASPTIVSNSQYALWILKRFFRAFNKIGRDFFR